MAYIPTRSSFTGPSKNIGKSSEYHIDLGMLESLPLVEKIKAFDSLANQYASQGREIEFSNQGVAGKRYSTALPMDDRAQLLIQAANAHASRPGWSKFDYYVPFKGKSRFDKGAVEGASIYLPGIAGGKVRRGTAGDYGFYSESLDPSGKVLFKVGHGDITRPEKGDVNVIGQAPPAPTLPTPEQNTDTLMASLFGKQESLKDVLTASLLQQAIARRQETQVDQLGLANPYKSMTITPEQAMQLFA
jgi:hypothetical protein